MTRASIAITGMGAISALGVGVDALERGIFEGVSAIRRITRFDTAGFETSLGAFVEGEGDGVDLAVEIGIRAAREAIDHARLHESGRGDLARVALVLGGSVGSPDSRPTDLGERIANALGLGGPRITVSTACTASANAVGLAADLLRAGAVDIAIAGGTDVVTPQLFAGFHALGALGSAPCAPFGLPTGTTLGDGAGFFVLERAETPRAPIAWFRGYGLSSDAYHATSPDPSGAGIARAILTALADCDLDARAIEYVNAHGTGTEANDAAEILGITSALDRGDLPISSSKGSLGHAQGAAGILELIVTALALRAQRLPPTRTSDALRRGAPRDPVRVARDAKLGAVMSVNAAFAGANSAVVLATEASSRASSTPPRSPVFVHGLGSTHVLDALTSAMLSHTALARRAEPCDLSRDLPMADPRGMDPSTRFIALALARAVRDAGIPKTNEPRDRVGVIAAMSRCSPVSANDFRISERERGLPKINASAFSRLVPNAPAGAASRMLSLRGPLSTLITGMGGGLVAFAYAAEMLSHSGARIEKLACAAVDEVALDPAVPEFTEGAAAIVLSREPDENKIRVAEWAIGAPGEARSLARLAGFARDVDLVLTDDASVTDFPRIVDVRRSCGDSAVASMFACAVAASSIRKKNARRVLVITSGGTASAAVVLEGESS